MKTKVTDLALFSNQHIFKPYASTLHKAMNGDPSHNLYMTLEMIEDLDILNVEILAEQYPEWWKLVKDRIDRIGFVFPSYIDHPMVVLIEDVKGI